MTERGGEGWCVSMYACVCVSVLRGNEIDSEEEQNREVGFCACANVFVLMLLCMCETERRCVCGGSTQYMCVSV